MGIIDLKKCINLSDYKPKTIRLTKLAGKKIAIDGNIYLYRFSYDKCDVFKSFMAMINRLKKMKINPIVFFDGEGHKYKTIELKRRRKIEAKKHKDIKILENKASKDHKYDEELEKKKKQLTIINEDKVDMIHETLINTGIPSILINKFDAEGLAAKMSYDKDYDIYGVMSEDTDCLAYGTKKLLTGYKNSSDEIIEYDLDDIFNTMGDITRWQFIRMCVRLGSDYNKRQYGNGPVNVYKKRFDDDKDPPIEALPNSKSDTNEKKSNDNTNIINDASNEKKSNDNTNIINDASNDNEKKNIINDASNEKKNIDIINEKKKIDARELTEDEINKLLDDEWEEEISLLFWEGPKYEYIKPQEIFNKFCEKIKNIVIESKDDESSSSESCSSNSSSDSDNKKHKHSKKSKSKLKKKKKISNSDSSNESSNDDKK